MKFKQINTGVILETKNEFVIEQLKKSADYEEVKAFYEKEPVEEKKDKKSSKKVKEL